MGQDCSSTCSNCKGVNQTEIRTNQDDVKNENSEMKSAVTDTTDIMHSIAVNSHKPKETYMKAMHAPDQKYGPSDVSAAAAAGGGGGGHDNLNSYTANDKHARLPVIVKGTDAQSSHVIESTNIPNDEATRLANEYNSVENPMIDSGEISNKNIKSNKFTEKSAPSTSSPAATVSASHEHDPNRPQQSQEREMRPKYQFKGGAVYEGQWIGTNRDGQGVQIWPDGAKYDGEWKENKAHGQGKFWHVDGDIFEGQWENDKANGYGTYVHINGAKYVGNWKDDLQNGMGVETWADGSKYEGNYKEGKKDGKGTYVWSDGSKYVGSWVENRISGTGTYSWLDGRHYEGEWLNNNMHGRGVYSWKDGRRYEGEYQYDKKHGLGSYTWADGKHYDGQWAYGKQHGKGKYRFVDGTVRQGQWEEGKRIRWTDNDQDADPKHGSSQKEA